MPSDLQRLQKAVDDRVSLPTAGHVFYGCKSFTPHRDAAYTKQDDLGRWKAPRKRRKAVAATMPNCPVCGGIGGLVTPGSRRYAECCGRFGQDSRQLYGAIDADAGADPADRADEANRTAEAVRLAKGKAKAKG